MPQKQRCRLSDSVVPNHYAIRLTPNVETFEFTGTVLIDALVKEPVTQVTLHAVDLAIQTVRVWSARHKDHPTPVIRMDPESETATFTFAQELPVGRLILEIDYTGTLNDKMAGFYRSKYTDAAGQEKHLATTQFEATDARRALPCWDEPACKATFDVTLVVPSNLTALSNMPIRGTYYYDGALKEVIFDRTPVMSTYLLAFIVGELEHREARTANGTQVRIYALPGRSHQGQFALETAVRVLEFYNEYFGIPYPLPKLDMIAIPDFSANAMENWGLITYRENIVLVDPASSSNETCQEVTETIAHELAHQWFGNLVTMEWWTNLWLNESFATWMGSLAMDHLFPKWDIWTQFVAKEYASALSLDALRSTHPIEVEVGHPNEISEIFDEISYSKGASIIRMLHDDIGADAFRAGMQIYLKRHAYGNATTEDLWAALAEASGQPIHAMMDTWTKQPGFPLLVVKPQEHGMRTITQQRFIADGDVLTAEESAQRWYLPVSYLHCGDPEPRKQFLSKDALIVVPNETLKVNVGQIPLARVSYVTDRWPALIEAVRTGILSAPDRLGLVSDALSLTRAGRLGADTLVRLLSAYENETNYSVWSTIIGALGALDSILEETPDESRLASLARTLLTPIARTLSWYEEPNDSHLTKLLRGPILGAIGGYGENLTIASASSAFDESLRCGGLHPNLRTAIYGIVARYGDRGTLANLIGLYEREPFQEEKVRLLNAMGRFTDPSVIPLVLEYVFNTDNVRPGDLDYVLESMGSHAKGRRAAWQFLVNNWDTLHKRYATGGLKMIGEIISDICDGFARAEDADTIERFFAEHPAPSATRAIAEASERIRVRAAWYERDKAAISAALPD
jgi:puromycin-sensitive aminopeptidase